jgi:hypothetical protein
MPELWQNLDCVFEDSCNRAEAECPASAGFSVAKTGNLGPAPLKMPVTLCPSPCVKKPAYSADEPFLFNSSSTRMPR